MNKKTKEIIIGVVVFAVGLCFGFVMEQITLFISKGGMLLPVLSVVKDISADLTLAVFVGTLIAYFSRNPGVAATRTFFFAFGILVSFYIYRGVAVEFLPMYYLIRWTIYSLLAGLTGYVVWHSKKAGWPAAVAAALPMGYLLAKGYVFYKTLAFGHAVALALAVILFIILPRQKNQRWKALPLAIAVALIIINFQYIIRLLGVV